MLRLTLSDDDLELALTPLQAARAKLAEPVAPRPSVMALLLSVGLAATAALALAATVILGPPATQAQRAEPIGVSSDAAYAPPD